LPPSIRYVKKLKEAHPERAADIDSYVAYAAAANDIDRLSTARVKDGHFFGRLRHASPHG